MYMFLRHVTAHEKCPYLEFFQSVFSRIRTEYGEMRSIEVSLRIQFEYRKIRTKKTPNTDTFHAESALGVKEGVMKASL